MASHSPYGSRQGTMSTAEEIAQILLDIGAVAISVAEPFTYASGIKSPIYCDNRLLMSHPRERGVVIDRLAAVLEKAAGLDSIDVVAGVATSGIPFAAWLAHHLGKPMVYVRSAPKEHGRQQQMEGRLQAGQRTVVVEDLVTTGGSALETVAALRAAGAVVERSTAIFTYEAPRAAAAFEQAGVQLLALSGISALLQVAIGSGRISVADADAVRNWLQSFTA